MAKEKKSQPPQQQQPPGVESEMKPKPKADDAQYRGSGKLQDKVALITGGDSGIGRAVANLLRRSFANAFAKEGADVAIVYLKEHEDAKETKTLVEKQGRRAVAIAGDITDENFCHQAAYQCGYGDDINTFARELRQACEQMNLQVKELSELITDQDMILELRTGEIIAPETASEL